MSSGDSFLATRRKKDVGAPLIETALRNSSMPSDAKGESRHYSTTTKEGEKVKTIREPSYAQLLVDSLDRYNNGTPNISNGGQTTSSTWGLQLPSYVLNGYFTRLAVSQIQFEWNLPTVIAGYNDAIFVQQGAVVYFAVIPEGFYDASGLAAAVTTAFLSATPGAPPNPITCTYSPIYKALTLTVATGTITIADTGSVPTRQSRFGTTSGLLFGSYGSSVTTPTALIVGNPPTMLATRFIDLKSAYLAKNQKVKDFTTLPGNIVSDIIVRIYAAAPNTSQVKATAFASPWMMNITLPVPKYIRWNEQEPISNFTLELLDDGGQILPWGPDRSCEYALTMYASES